MSAGIEPVNVGVYNFQDTTGDENKTVILEKLNEIIDKLDEFEDRIADLEPSS